MKKLLTILTLTSLLLLSSCSTSPTPQLKTKNSKLKITTTLFPLYEFAKEIGGEKAEVTLLLPPGTEPHSFEPRPSDIKKIIESDVFLFIGESMEPWAHDILEGLDVENLSVIEASDHVNILKTNESNETNHHHKSYDPHIWLDFTNDIKLIKVLLKTFIEKDFENSDFYTKNSEDYILKLKNLDSKYSKTLKSCKKNIFITGGHDAYGYLKRAYEIDYISVHGLSPDSSPTPKTMKKIIDLSKLHDIEYILFENLINPDLAKILANEIKAETLILKTAGNITKKEFESGISFIDIMNKNLENLSIALECNE